MSKKRSKNVQFWSFSDFWGYAFFSKSGFENDPFFGHFLCHGIRWHICHFRPLKMTLFWPLFWVQKWAKNRIGFLTFFKKICVMGSKSYIFEKPKNDHFWPIFWSFFDPFFGPKNGSKMTFFIPLFWPFFWV